MRLRAGKSHVLPLVLASLLMAGCSTNRFTLDTEFDAPPVKNKTIMHEALVCLHDRLNEQSDSELSYVFMVRDVVDGTIKANDYADGPLADSGRLQLISTLSAYIHPGYGVVADRFPLVFTPLLNERIGLSRFGFPSEENVSGFLPKYLAYTNRNRQVRGMSQLNQITPLIIDGAFTRFDSSHTHSKGYGQNAGYRGDVETEESAAVDFGKSGSERSITLMMNIIDPITNVVVGTEGFDLKFYSKSKKARFRVAVDDYYYGFSNSDVRVETPHAAQQVLLDAATVWILDNAFGHQVNFDSCFHSEERLALGTDRRYREYAAAKMLAGQKNEIAAVESTTEQVTTEQVKVEPVPVAEKAAEQTTERQESVLNYGSVGQPVSKQKFSKQQVDEISFENPAGGG